jgi:hypothetical protein
LKVMLMDLNNTTDVDIYGAGSRKTDLRLKESNRNSYAFTGRAWSLLLE